MLCSNRQTATTTITTVGRRYLMGACLYANNQASDIVLTVYNGDASSEATTTREIMRVSIDVSIEGGPTTKTEFLAEPVRCTDGIYAVASGTGNEYIIYYR